MSSGTLPKTGTTTSQGFNIRDIFGRDLGQLPVIGAMILIAVYFQIDSNGLFLTPRNLSNLFLQNAVLGIVSLAAVLVLLIGEIDLSLAAVSSLCGAVMVTSSVQRGWSPFASIVAALLVGLVIGIINGVIIAFLRVPSFIVSLAALIGYSGLLEHTLLPQTTIRLTDPWLRGIAANYADTWLGLGFPIAAVAIYVGVTLYQEQARRRVGLATAPLAQLIVRLGIVIGLTIIGLSVFYNYFGVPYSTLVLVGLVAIFWLIMRFTPFGRHVYAVGGNAEASRRVGINVTGVRVAVFALASTLASVAGILESSRTISASAQVSNSLLLNAIAAAVIGGVSLFGGRGSVWSVMLGLLVIGGLLNGLVLQGRSGDIQLMVEAVVLILAVILDAVLRRRSAT
jgi:D-xylose transport system permease protein